MERDEQRKSSWRRRALWAGAGVLAVALPTALYHAPAQYQFMPSAGAPAKLWPVQRRAQFGPEPAGRDARRLANWVVDSGDNQAKSFVVIDKSAAKVYLFDPKGRLKAATPAVLGAAHGDDTAPGIGNKPLKDIQFEERTTPAGRFVASVGESSSRNEDVVWVDYDAAVSMHRIIKTPERVQAVSTPSPDDNRLSYGCINLPDSFYEGALRPAVNRTGVIVYVLPETRPLDKTFAGFYDVDAPKLAQH